jgi:phage baseplate assembly protein gpV
MYDSSRAGTSVRIVEHLTVEGGKITSSTVVTDSGAFMAFLGQ